jgi:hypothetical protein
MMEVIEDTNGDAPGGNHPFVSKKTQRVATRWDLITIPPAFSLGIQADSPRVYGIMKIMI